MRFIVIFFLMLFASMGFAQAQSKPLAMADPAFNTYFYKTKAPIVSGKIINVTSDELKTLTITYSQVVPFEGFQEKGACQIKSDGTFSFQLDFPFPYQQIWFSLGDYFYSGIYVNKGLYLELDFAQLKKQNLYWVGPGVKYQGADGPVTEYLNKFVQFKREEQLAASSAINKLEYNDKDYLKKVDSLFVVEASIAADYIRQNPSSDSWILENERLSNYYAILIRYGLTNNTEPVKWKEINEHKPKLVSNDSGDYFQALYSYLFFGRAKGDPAVLAKFTDIPNINPLILKASGKDIRANEALLGKLKNEVKTPWLKTVLEKQYETNLKRLNEVNSLLRAGTKLDAADTTLGEAIAAYPFGAKLYNAANITAADFLAKLTSKFKGKAMVVDIWATWCMPCIASMPSSAKLHHAATDLPLEFVYLCTVSGSDKIKWQDKVVEMKQPGTHIFMDDKLTNELMAMFKKGGYPSYICFNRDGQVSKELSINSMMSVSLDDLKKLVGEEKTK